MSIIPLVRTQLPEGGLEALWKKSWIPINNALGNRHTNPQPAEAFPLMWAIMAPSSKAFLTSLGKPLAIARDLESEPGIWLLSTPDERYDFIVFSDCHRKGAWKGGQLCLAKKSSANFTPQHPALEALVEGFAQVWGRPEVTPDTEPSFFQALEWFDVQGLRDPHRTWPRFNPPAARLRP